MDNGERRDDVERLIREQGFSDYKWIVPRDHIVVSSWVRFRCQFGCNNYGKNGSCPPAVPPVEECRRMIYEYDNAVIFHFPMREETYDGCYRLMAGLSELERAVFLAGYYKVFLLQYGSCMFCKECGAGGLRAACVNKAKCRPGADAMGVDIYQTAHNVGYPVQVVKQHGDPTNRFAFLLVD